MKKTILFPYDIKDDNRADYCRTIEWAEKQQADLIFLTTLDGTEKEEKLDEVYFHILSLNGYYQNKNGWKRPTVFIENIIKKGRMIDYLKRFIQEKKPNWIVSHSGSAILNRTAIESVLPMSHEFSILPIIL